MPENAAPERVAARHLFVVGMVCVGIGLVGNLLPGVGGVLSLFLYGGLFLWAIAAGVILVGATVGSALSRLLTQFYGASGASTPAPRGYSAIETLEARGAYGEAAAAYRGVIAGSPRDWETRVRLAELLVRRLDDPRQAAALYREARDLVPDEGRKLRFSLRLVEICDRHLHDPGRTVVELRRLLDSFPDFPHRAVARAELDRLLADMDR